MSTVFVKFDIILFVRQFIGPRPFEVHLLYLFKDPQILVAYDFVGCLRLEFDLLYHNAIFIAKNVCNLCMMIRKRF